jgi:hypothetical protein
MSPIIFEAFICLFRLLFGLGAGLDTSITEIDSETDKAIGVISGAIRQVV